MNYFNKCYESSKTDAYAPREIAELPEVLRDHGLDKLGSWVKSHHATVIHLRTECSIGINYDIAKEWHTKRDVIYAFVVNGSICYLGETTAGMASRFNGYRYGNPLITDTDNRIKRAITRALMDGYDVEIWAGQPISQLVLPNGTILRMPASKPLEEYLIALTRPDLNVKSIGEGRPTLIF